MAAPTKLIASSLLVVVRLVPVGVLDLVVLGVSIVAHELAVADLALQVLIPKTSGATILLAWEVAHVPQASARIAGLPLDEAMSVLHCPIVPDLAFWVQRSSLLIWAGPRQVELTAVDLPNLRFARLVPDSATWADP